MTDAPSNAPSNAPCMCGQQCGDAVRCTDAMRPCDAPMHERTNELTQSRCMCLREEIGLKFVDARTRTALLEELAAGRRYGETWAQWNDRVVALVEALR